MIPGAPLAPGSLPPAAKPRSRIRFLAATVTLLILFSAVSWTSSSSSYLRLRSGLAYSGGWNATHFSFFERASAPFLGELVQQLQLGANSTPIRSAFEVTCSLYSQARRVLAGRLSHGGSLTLAACDPSDVDASTGVLALYGAEGGALPADVGAKFDLLLLSLPLEAAQLAALRPVLDARAARAAVACLAAAPAGRPALPEGWLEDPDASRRLRGAAVAWCPGALLLLRPAAAAAPLEIVAAQFGAPADEPRGTDGVAGPSGLFLRSSRAGWMGRLWGDPAPGRPKALAVTYRWEGQERRVVVPEEATEVAVSPFAGPAQARPGPRTVLVCPKIKNPAYIHQTLASLLLSDPRSGEYALHLVVGGTDAEYLKPYAHHPRVKARPAPAPAPALARRRARGGRGQVHAMGEEEARSIAHRGLRKRATYNYRRPAPAPAPPRSALGPRRGVVFAEGFFDRLQAAVDAIERAGHAKYILSAYYDFDLGVPARFEESTGRWEAAAPFAPYAKDPFECTQGMFYPASVVRPLADYMLEVFKSPEEHWDPYDVIVEWFHSRTATPLFATSRSLVQHAGSKTTGPPRPCPTPARARPSILTGDGPPVRRRPRGALAHRPDLRGAAPAAAGRRSRSGAAR
eukprot:tig00001098_g7058.t1